MILNKKPWDAIRPLIPAMASNTQDGFVVSAKAVDADYPPYYAFDQNNSTHWYYYNGNGHTQINLPWWLMIEMPSARLVSRVKASFEYINSRLSGNLTGKLYYSNDGTTFISVANSIFSLSTTGGVSEIDISFAPVKAKYLQLYFSDVPTYVGQYLIGVYDVQYYGV